MHKSRLGTIVIDCKGDDLVAAAGFWSRALGFDFDIEADGKYAVGQSPQGEPGMLLQHVSHESRLHLDIETDDQESERARLEAIGARLVERCEKGWLVMEAPTGHRFCLVNPQRNDFATAAKTWGS